MLNLKQPNIHNSNGDICTGYSWCGIVTYVQVTVGVECGIVTYVQVTVGLLNVEFCNSVSISILWQHKMSINQWMEYRNKY